MFRQKISSTFPVIPPPSPAISPSSDRNSPSSPSLRSTCFPRPQRSRSWRSYDVAGSLIRPNETSYHDRDRRSGLQGRPSVRRRVLRQANRENATPIHLARHADPATVQEHHLANNRQTEARAGLTRRGFRPGLSIFLENMRHLVPWNAEAGIAHFDLHDIFLRFQDDIDRAAARGELKRVSEQIAENL